MPKYKAAFEDGSITIPRSDDVLQDHRALKIVRGVPRLPPGKTNKAGDRHGDSAIALALAFYGCDQDAGPIDFTSVGPRAVSNTDAFVGNTANYRAYR